MRMSTCSLKAACVACGACGAGPPRCAFPHAHREQHVMHVVQGLIDAHVHMLIGGASLHQIDLRGIASKADFVAAVQDAAGGLAFVRIIFHINWALCLLQLSYGEKTTPRLCLLFTVSYWETTTPRLWFLFTVSYWEETTPRL